MNNDPSVAVLVCFLASIEAGGFYERQKKGKM